MKKVARKYIPGSNYGSCFGPMVAPSYTDKTCWRLNADEETTLWQGLQNLCGGCVACDDAPPKPACDDSKEACWHFMNPTVFGELFHSFKPKALVKMSDVDHTTWALVRLASRLVCRSDTHRSKDPNPKLT